MRRGRIKVWTSAHRCRPPPAAGRGRSGGGTGWAGCCATTIGRRRSARSRPDAIFERHRLFLARYAGEVVFVHRRDRPRAGPALQGRARAEPKARFLWDTVVAEILGDEEVEGVRLRDARTGAETTLAAGAVFPFIGHRPGSDLLHGQVALDARGYVVTDGRTRTSVPGVFAAGDVADPVYRQAVTAAATGSMAAMEAARFLAELDGSR